MKQLVYFCSRVEHDLYLPVASLVLPFWTPVAMIKDISYLVMFVGSFPSHSTYSLGLQLSHAFQLEQTCSSYVWHGCTLFLSHELLENMRVGLLSFF